MTIVTPYATSGCYDAKLMSNMDGKANTMAR